VLAPKHQRSPPSALRLAPTSTELAPMCMVGSTTSEPAESKGPAPPGVRRGRVTKMPLAGRLGLFLVRPAQPTPQLGQARGAGLARSAIPKASSHNSRRSGRMEVVASSCIWQANSRLVAPIRGVLDAGANAA
jgi:hypothetical protein